MRHCEQCPRLSFIPQSFASLARAQCVEEWHKNSDGTCAPCASGTLSISDAKTLFLGLGAGIAALVLLLVSIITCGVNEMMGAIRASFAVLAGTVCLRGFYERRRLKQRAEQREKGMRTVGAEASSVRKQVEEEENRARIFSGVASSIREFAAEKVKMFVGEHRSQCSGGVADVVSYVYIKSHQQRLLKSFLVSR